MKIFQLLLIFFAKSFIFIVTFFLVLLFFILDTSKLESHLKEFASNKANQAMLLSFIQNPEALSIASDRDLFREKFDDAQLKLEIALGLLEMHGASQELINQYESRIYNIKKKINEQNADLKVPIN